MHALLEGVAGAAIVLATLFLVYGIFKATDGRKQKEHEHEQGHRSDRP